ncbi:hypothetical protein B0T11DRAFT_327223 [Plectosphaerella cucumerina]|uniref:Uncharacterized protein n=1 Tax=Plectosphaerella cucumerina TaxID=40658 RepID=A0A8K0X7Y8_9PEZI|nr:hypothetical protein B0T11DRAFT_327223 [Plectosphaerella cucumerina]
MANHMSSQMGMFPGNMAHVHVPNAFQDPAIAAATPAFSVNMPDASGRAQQSHHHVVDPSLEMASHRDSGGMGQGQGPHVAFAPMATGPMQDMPEPPHFMVPAGEQPETQNGAGEHTAVPRRLVVDPPNLQEWRQRLFDADELIILTNDQFETYFPHVDNVYSHRSTQRYKRKPFVSHYYDCRLKGRPPGTPKSDDPNKKKRKRTARELNQCDVKIKITEYSSGATLQDLDDDTFRPIAAPDDVLTPSTERRFRVVPAIHSSAFGAEDEAGNGIGRDGQKFWTIQRINGHATGSGVAGPHKHDLARSDQVKKNSIMRMLAKQEAEAKKNQAPRKASAAAAATVRKHAKESDTKLYAACFCPFSQRVWIALEAKKLPYQYIETDPSKRPASAQLLEANPKGTVPAIREGDWACSESTVILEYLEDVDRSNPLFPSDPRLRANCRQWIHHIDTAIIPAFYQLLRSTDSRNWAEPSKQLQQALRDWISAADEEGPFFLGDTLSMVDVHLAPFALRFPRMLESQRGWTWTNTSDPDPERQRWDKWLEAIEENPSVKATTSGKELYVQTLDVVAAAESTPVMAPPQTIPMM